MDQQEVDKIAQEVRGYLEAAVGDCAQNHFIGGKFYDEGNKKVAKLVRDAEKMWRHSPVKPDYIGMIADHYYDDPDLLFDLAGDRIYELSKRDKKTMIAVAKDLEESGHDAMKKAMKKLIAHWNKYDY